MLGCVLCAPGCFSLYRASSLLDDNVMRKFTSVGDEANQILQWDLGITVNRCHVLDNL